MVDFSCHSRSEISENRAFNAAGRFEAEYVTLKKLGRGGFSSVYMVKNLLDDSLSAVKKIVIRVNNTNKHNIQNEVKSALQEIRTLANIRSEHVVLYKHSWIEVKLKEDIFNDDKDSYFENKDESFELSYNNNNSTHKAKEEDDIIEFLESSKNSFKNEEPSFRSNRRATLKSLNLPCHSNKILLGSVEYEY